MLRTNRIRRIAALFAATVAFIAAFAPAATADQSVRPLAGFTLTSLDADASGKCLDVYNWGQGPWIQMYAPCHGGSNQDWEIFTRDGATWLIRSIGTGKVIDGYRGAYQQLVQWSEDGTTTQKWYLHDLGSGVYAFRNVAYPAYCMDVYDWGRGAVVQLYDCHYEWNQLWTY